MEEERDNQYDFELEWMKRMKYREGEWRGRGIISPGIYVSESMQRVIERHTEICKIYSVPSLSILKTSSLNVRRVFENIGRKENDSGRLYAKTAYRFIIMYSVYDAMFPVIFRNKANGDVASIADIDEKICVHGRSCIRQIEKQVGLFFSNEWLTRYASNCSRYLGTDPATYFVIIRASYDL